MTLEEQIDFDLKEALKSGDTLRRSVLGMIMAAVRNKEIEKKKQHEGLNDEETIGVVASEAKKRADAIDSFRKGGRDDLAQKEGQELEMIKKYLPPELAEEEVKAVLEKTIADTGTKAKKDFGRIMAAAMKELKNRASGQTIKRILDGLLE